LGRRDVQVKVRGYRIELEEIENALRTFADVEEAVVLLKETNEDSELVGYITGVVELDRESVWRQVQERLPKYMMPSEIVVLEALPLTANGKLDRNALGGQDIGKQRSAGMYEAPRTEVERVLSEIWQEVLGVERIGINSSFFMLGGNSLKIIRMQQLVNKSLDVDFSIDKYFEFITIGDLAHAIEEIKKTGEEQPEATQAEKIEVLTF